MALLFAESFDSYGQGPLINPQGSNPLWWITSGDVTITGEEAATGPCSVRLKGAAYLERMTTPEKVGTGTLSANDIKTSGGGFACKIRSNQRWVASGGLYTVPAIYPMIDAIEPLFMLILNNTGTIGVCQDGMNFNNVSYTTAPVIVRDQWHSLAVEFFPNNTGLAWECRLVIHVDGATVLDQVLTYPDTSPNFAATWFQIYWTLWTDIMGVPFAEGELFVDDFIFWNGEDYWGQMPFNAYPGPDIRVFTLYPTPATQYPLPGWADPFLPVGAPTITDCINKPIPDDATFLRAYSPSNWFTEIAYQFDALQFIPANIIGVKVNARSRSSQSVPYYFDFIAYDPDTASMAWAYFGFEGVYSGQDWATVGSVLELDPDFNPWTLETLSRNNFGLDSWQMIGTDTEEVSQMYVEVITVGNSGLRAMGDADEAILRLSNFTRDERKQYLEALQAVKTHNTGQE